MIKVEILPLSNDAEGVEISIYSYEIYWLTIRMYFGQNNAFKKEKTDFLTTHRIFSLSSPGTLSNDFQW